MNDLALANAVLDETLPLSAFERALAQGDARLAAEDLRGALERYLAALTAREPDDAPSFLGPDTLDRVRLQVRIATACFGLGAEQHGRACLARAADLADQAAWAPPTKHLDLDPEPAVAMECRHWVKVTECAGLDEDELERLADLLRRWGCVYERGGDERGVHKALPFWTLCAHLHERRCPDDTRIG